MTNRQPSDLASQRFILQLSNRDTVGGITALHVHVTDRFHNWKHGISRKAITLFTRTLDRYLRKRPHLTFDHPRNYVRRIVYFPPAFRAWTAYMPGGFATYSVHNPDHSRLYSGKKIDLITKNLFRHSIDAIGVRSRAYAMAWYVHHKMHSRQKLKWLSIAAGTGQPMFDAATILPAETTYYLTDMDGEALKFAEQLSKTYQIPSDFLYTSRLDVTRKGVLDRLMLDTAPDVIDAMGFFEYLDDDSSVEMLSIVQRTMKKGSVFVFTNMLSSRDQLDVHQRGMGWPGVIPRSIQEVSSLLTRAGIEKTRQTVILPDDGVYGVYVIERGEHG